MKKNRLHILIIVLIVSQMLSILKIDSLKREIENTKNQMSYLNSTIRNDMDTIYSNVDEMLKQKASLIESATAEIGIPNIDQLTVPITFTLTPKEVTEHTAVSLDLEGLLFPMEKNDTAFTATFTRNIFGDVLPKIVIVENGIKKTIEDERISIWSIKDRFFPIIYPRFIGQEGFDGKNYQIEGKLIAEIKEVESTIKYTKVRFVIKADDKLIVDEIIPNEMLYSGYEVNEKIPLSKGNVCTVTVIATDNMELEHHYTVGYWITGSSSQRELGFGGEYIYDTDGKLLWDSENNGMYYK